MLQEWRTPRQCINLVSTLIYDHQSNKRAEKLQWAQLLYRQSTHNNDRDLYFLSFAEENSKCIGNASIILSKNCIERTRFYPALLLTRKDSLTLTVLSPNSFPSLTLFQPTHATTGKWLHYRGSRLPEIPPL